MRILLSAFACVPNAGSEGGVGWFWAQEWAKDHEVVVITDITRRAALEAELARKPVANLQVLYFRPAWLKFMPLNSVTAQFLYQLWQVGLVPYARTLHNRQPFHLAHHATYGVFRQPSFLGRLGLPLVFGPVGGGEDAPWCLKRSMSLRERARELARTALNQWARIDPMLRSGLRGCSLILAKTAATARALPSGFESRTQVALEIGTLPRPGVTARSTPSGRVFRFIYAGNLLALKGMHLGLAALAHAQSQGAELSLTIVGTGPQEVRLRALTKVLGLQASVRWTGRLPQHELLDVYRDHDALLFPSLHDSSGNVVMEALSFALPVVCLALGGPADIVTPRCGRAVSTQGLDESGVIHALAKAMVELQQDPALYTQLSHGALQRASELDWQAQAQRIKQAALACATLQTEGAA